MSGTVVELIEQVAELAAEQAVEETNLVADLLGDQPAFSRALDSEEEALRFLPTWLAHRHDLAWWQQQIAQHADNTITPPIKTLMRFSLRMQDLLVRYPGHAVLGMSPESVASYGQQIAVQPQPQVGIPQAPPPAGIGPPIVEPKPLRGV